MNYRVEKWVTIAALTGWLGSMGSMMVLAVNEPPKLAVQQATQQFSTRNTTGVQLSPQVRLTPLTSKVSDQSGVSRSSEFKLTPVPIASSHHWLDQRDPYQQKY